MKNVIIIIVFTISIHCLTAQKVIEKKIDHKNRYVELKVPFASTIEVKTWNKPSVYFKATVAIKDDQFIEKYDVKVEETQNKISILEHADDVFEAFHRYGRKKDPENLRCWYNSGDLCEFNYVLYVPKNTSFLIKSINGDMKSETIEGDFTADLINGNIDIKAYKGDLDLSTINGEIDLNVGNASLVAETIHGDIYADEKLNLTSYDKHVGQKVEKRLSNAQTRLKLNTINGNMYLRL